METEGGKPQEPVKGVHLWLLLWKATRMVEAHAHHSIEATDLGLSDFGVLEALLHKGPLPIKALQKKVLLSSGSMTAAVDRLERAGLVERATTPDDRRSRIVHLTPKGSELISRLFRTHASDMEKAFSCLDSTERAHLAAMLRKLGRDPENSSAPNGKTVAQGMPTG